MFIFFLSEHVTLPLYKYYCHIIHFHHVTTVKITTGFNLNFFYLGQRKVHISVCLTESVLCL